MTDLILSKLAGTLKNTLKIGNLTIDSSNLTQQRTLTASDNDGTILLTSTAALVTNPLSQFAQTTSLQLKDTISDETGSGSLVFSTSPTLVTPILGTPTSGNLTNCTFPTLNQNTSGSAGSVPWSGISSIPTPVSNLSGTNTGDQTLSDATISTTDITTNNFSTTKHGFVPKGTNTGNFLKDDGTWATVSTNSSVDTISALLSYSTINMVSVLGYHTKNDGGGGTFYYSSSTSKALHNGGTVIDPSKTFPSDWTNETVKATWYNITGSGTGCWLRVADANSNLGLTFGIKTDGASDNTLALAKAISILTTVLLPGGIYKTKGQILPTTFKILSTNSTKIEFQTSDNAVLFDMSNNVDQINCEFHGILTNTSSTGGSALYVGGTGICTGCNFDDLEVNTLLNGQNGVQLGICWDNQKVSWVKDFSMKRAKYNSGRICFECNNSMTNPVLTGVTIANPAVFTCTLAKLTSGSFIDPILGDSLRVGQKIIIESIVGTGAVANLNENVYTATNVTAHTFQLLDHNGVAVSTVGGTYTSGGNVYIFRAEHIDITGAKFIKAGAGYGSGMGLRIGASFSGPVLDCKLNDMQIYDCPDMGVELYGAYNEVDNLQLIDCTGVAFSSAAALGSNGFYNRFTNWKSIGKISGGSAAYMYNQISATIDGCSINAVYSFVFQNFRKGRITRSKFKSDYYVAIDFHGTDANTECSNNYLDDVFIDTSAANNVNPGISISGAFMLNNTFEHLVIKAGSPVTSAMQTDGLGTNNSVISYRDVSNSTWAQTPPWIVGGNCSTFNTLAGTAKSELTIVNPNSGFATGFFITLVNPRAAGGGQPVGIFHGQWSMRQVNTVFGGTFDIAFGNYSQPTYTPVFSYTGTLLTLIQGTDSNGKVYWRLAPIINATAMITNRSYIIDVPGTVPWTTLGAANGNVGTGFTYNGTTVSPTDGAVLIAATDYWTGSITCQIDKDYPTGYSVTNNKA